jgi:hypothetical protein
MKSSKCLAALLCFVLCLCVACNPRFVCVIDAGSTGSRVYVYSYSESSPLESLRGVGQKRIRPSLASFAGDDVGLAQHMRELLEAAASWVPSEEHPRTSVTLMATAGMRSVSDSTQQSLISAVHSILDASPFLHPSISSAKRSRVLSGTEEAMYDFLAVRAAFYSALGEATEVVGLRGGEGENSGEISIAVADLGSSSTQYAYVCNPVAAASAAAAHAPAGVGNVGRLSKCGDVDLESSFRRGKTAADVEEDGDRNRSSLHARSAAGLGLIEGMETLIRRYERQRMHHSCAKAQRSEETELADAEACFAAREGQHVWGPVPPNDTEELGLPSWAVERARMGNPCLPTDFIGVKSVDGASSRMVRGSGDFDSCVRLIREYLVPSARAALCPNSSRVPESEVNADGSADYSDESSRGSCSPRGRGPRYLIGLDNFPKILEVLGVHTVAATHQVAGLAMDGSIDVHDFKATLRSLAISPGDIALAGRATCSQSWADILSSLAPGEPEWRAQRACYGAAFIYALLTSVYGVSHDAAEFVPLGEVLPFGELGWALGAGVSLALSAE